MKLKILFSIVSIFVLGSLANLSAENRGNLVFVDAVNGNDSTGTPGRSDLPYLTLGAAKTAASSGDTIHVRPGAYTGNDLLKDGVDWHFETGAAVTRGTGSSSGIFDDYTGHNNSFVNCVISGEGDFDGNGGYVLQVKSSNHGDSYGSNVSFTAGNVVSSGGPIAIRALNVTVRARLVQGGGGNGAIYYNRGNVDIHVDQIISSSTPSIYIDVPDDEMSAEFYRLRMTVGKVQNTASTGNAIYWKSLVDNADLHINASKVITPSIAIDSSTNSTAASHLFVRANSIAGQVKLRSGDLSLIGSSVVKSDSGDGVTVLGGAVTIIGGKITTQSGSNDLSRTGGTLTVLGCAYAWDKTSGTITQGDPRVMPLTLYVKNVTVLTTGAPADIASITIPSGTTRFKFCGTTAQASTSNVVAETAAGTLAGASFTVYDAASGGGTQISAAFNGPSTTTGAGQAVPILSNSSTTAPTSSTLYIRQTANSANVGTVSFYITIYPLP